MVTENSFRQALGVERKRVMLNHLPYAIPFSPHGILDHVYQEQMLLSRTAD